MQVSAQQITDEDKLDHKDDFLKFARFCSQTWMICRTYFGTRVFGTGGCVEFPAAFAADQDIMMENVPLDLIALSPDVTDRLKSAYKKSTILWICTEDGVHSGYSRLLLTDNGEYISRDNSLSSLHLSNSLPGPAVTVTRETQISNSVILRYLSNISIMYRNCVRPIDTDFVWSVPCPHWPIAAAEWITRKRPHGWPSVSMVKKCTRLGCHFVSAAHRHSSNPDIEFRYSFSLAEKELIESWLPVQKYIYAHLKHVKVCINTHVADERKILCSYHLKTLMLWSCENKFPSFWATSEILVLMKQLLLEIIEWLIDRRCFNYFIRDNNMFDHITDTEELQRLVCNLYFAAAHVEAFVNLEAYPFFTCNFQFMFPHGTLLAAHLMSLCYQRKTVMFELHDLYRGLSALNDLLKRVTYLAASEFETRLQIIEECLREATAHDDREVSVKSMLSSSSSEFYRSSRLWNDDFEQQLHPTTWKRATVSSSHNFRNFATLPYVKKGEPHRWCDIIQEPNSEVACACARMRLMTVTMPHISKFCSMAHLINFLYAVRGDYRSAIAMSDNVIADYLINPVSDAELAMFVIPISVEWSSLFDDHFKMMLGFFALYNEVRRRAKIETSDYEFFIPVCPMLFILYIRIRCLQKLAANNSSSITCINSSVTSAIDDFHKHINSIDHFLTDCTLGFASDLLQWLLDCH